jgi:hypothetical protein
MKNFIENVCSPQAFVLLIKATYQDIGRSKGFLEPYQILLVIVDVPPELVFFLLKTVLAPLKPFEFILILLFLLLKLPELTVQFLFLRL